MARGPRAVLLLLSLATAGVFAAYAARLSHGPVPRAPASGPAFQVVPDFSLTDASGRVVRGKDLQGPYVADFIYTRCTGQCPMMTERLKAIERDLPGARLVSFSVDPADTPEALGRFARRHKAGWLFLSGKGAARLAREGFKLPLQGGGPPEEPITHARTLVLVDAASRVRGYYDPEDQAAVQRLKDDLRRL